MVYPYNARCDVVYELAKTLLEKQVAGAFVDIGTGYGLTVRAEVQAKIETGKHVPIVTIDPYDENFSTALGAKYGKAAKQRFMDTVFSDAELNQHFIFINLAAEDVAEWWCQPIALLVIDTGMDFEALKNIFDLWYKWVVPHGIITASGTDHAKFGAMQLLRYVERELPFQRLPIAQPFLLVLERLEDVVPEESAQGLCDDE